MRKRETHLINEYGDRVTIQRTLPLDEEIKKLNESTNSNFHLDIEWYLLNGYAKLEYAIKRIESRSQDDIQ